MSKKQLVALAVAFAVLGTPLALAAPASAAPVSTTSSPIFTDRGDRDEDDEDEDEDDEDEDGWGHEDNHSLPPVVIRPHGDDDDEDEDEDDEDDEDEDDDEGGFVLPATPGVDPSAAPSVDPSASPYTSNNTASGANYSVSPLLPSVISGSPSLPLAPGGSDQVVGANAINPDAAPAIDPASIRTSAKTPADVFMESATWGLVAMGAGALALGSAAGVKSLSARRKPNADYFYDSEN